MSRFRPEQNDLRDILSRAYNANELNPITEEQERDLMMELELRLEMGEKGVSPTRKQGVRP